MTSTLPFELWSHMFSVMDLETQLKSRLVCKWWNDEILHYYLDFGFLACISANDVIFQRGIANDGTEKSIAQAATYGGNIPLLQAMHDEFRLSKQWKLLKYAVQARNNIYPTLQFLIENQYLHGLRDVWSQIMELCVRIDDPNLLKILERKPPYDLPVFIQNNAINCLHYVITEDNNPCRNSTKAWELAAQKGSIALCNELLEHYDPPECVLYHAAKHGHLECVQFLYNSGLHGRLESDFLEPLHENHLDIIDFLKSKGMKIRLQDCWQAVFLQLSSSPHALPMLRYLHVQGFPVDIDKLLILYHESTNNNNNKLDPIYNQWLCTLACLNGSLEKLNQFHNSNCEQLQPYDVEVACVSQSTQCLAYVLNQLAYDVKTKHSFDRAYKTVLFNQSFTCFKLLVSNDCRWNESESLLASTPSEYVQFWKQVKTLQKDEQEDLERAIENSKRPELYKVLDDEDEALRWALKDSLNYA